MFFVFTTRALHMKEPRYLQPNQVGGNVLPQQCIGTHHLLSAFASSHPSFLFLCVAMHRAGYPQALMTHSRFRGVGRDASSPPPPPPP